MPEANPTQFQQPHSDLPNSSGWTLAVAKDQFVQTVPEFLDALDIQDLPHGEQAEAVQSWMEDVPDAKFMPLKLRQALIGQGLYDSTNSSKYV